MKNAWKGLVMGGLTGVAAGVALDIGARGSEVAGTAGKKAASKIRQAAAQATQHPR